MINSFSGEKFEINYYFLSLKEKTLENSVTQLMYKFHISASSSWENIITVSTCPCFKTPQSHLPKLFLLKLKFNIFRRPFIPSDVARQYPFVKLYLTLIIRLKCAPDVILLNLNFPDDLKIAKVVALYAADNIYEMIEFLIDNIFMQSGGLHLRQLTGIPLLADLFLYSYESKFLDIMIRSGHRRPARSFNLCYRYTDD